MKSAAARAVPCGKVGHLVLHTVPNQGRRGLAQLVVLLWLCAVPWPLKARSPKKYPEPGLAIF